MNRHFKSILVVTDSLLGDGTGSGVTLGNLFSGWDRSKFALYSVQHDRRHGGLLVGDQCFANAGKSSADERRDRKPRRGPFARLRTLLDSSAIRPYLTLFAPISITRRAADEIGRKNFDIIYGPVSDIYSVRRLLKIRGWAKARLAVVFFDDLLNRYDGFFLASLYKRVHFQYLKYIVEISDAVFVCSEAMRAEYEPLFQRDLYVVSNPVDLQVVNAYRPTKPKEAPLKIIYAGTVNSKNILNLKLMCEAVRVLSDSGSSVNFEVFTFGTKLESVREDLRRYDTGVLVSLAPADDHELFSILSQASVLYLPLDFSEESIKSIRLSYLTKQPLYMALGIPIIVHGPRIIHVVEHALAHKYADVILDDSVEALVAALRNHIANYDEYLVKTQNGLDYATKFHEIKAVQTKFYNRLLGTA